MSRPLLLSACLLLLAGCDQLGIETPAQQAAALDAEGRAVGGACRHSGRALEDCYTMNSKASKAAIFTGWRDMDAYMRENNIEIVSPTIAKATKKGKESKEEADPAKAEVSPAKGEAPPAEKPPAKPPAPASKAQTPASPGGKLT